VDVSEMQRKLSQWATDDPTKRFVDLYSLLCDDEWLRVAHRKVNSNQGRETAGVDWQSMSNFNRNLEENLEMLRVTLKTRTFEPLPVRRVYIPKANGKKRPLGIPGIRDRIVQEALRMILEKGDEKRWEKLKKKEKSRLKRRAQNALLKAQKI